MNQVEDAASVLEQFQQDGECSLVLSPRTLDWVPGILNIRYSLKFTGRNTPSLRRNPGQGSNYPGLSKYYCKS